MSAESKMSLTHDEIDELFNSANEAEGEISDFVSDLYDQWEKKSWLSEKQISALRKIAENVEDRR